MKKLYQGDGVTGYLRSDILVIAAIFLLTILSLWFILDAAFPASTETQTTDVNKLRAEFDSKFGTDRTTVREAEHYRVIGP